MKTFLEVAEQVAAALLHDCTDVSILRGVEMNDVESLRIHFGITRNRWNRSQKFVVLRAWIGPDTHVHMSFTGSEVPHASTVVPFAGQQRPLGEFRKFVGLALDASRG
ncbi:MAG: hypothetical protein UY63_C0005G0045 [Parcubacteria group bacterium GW2011_GWA2_51_10]|nr:MAG: hypothetical protein UY63_C0005G0045 [Parcubacteria group bacterium GW2011_GWA2_51_10]